VETVEKRRFYPQVHKVLKSVFWGQVCGYVDKTGEKLWISEQKTIFLHHYI
jgi:hypothetical protein